MNNTIIRSAVAGDAKRFIDLWSTLQAETEGSLFEAGTHHLATVDYEHRPTTAKKGYMHILFLDDTQNKQLAGFTTASRCQSTTSASSIELIIAIKKAYTGRGWGRKLLQAMETWALNNDIQQLTLAVAAGNRPALALYRKFGFEIRTTKRLAVQTKDGLDDLNLMIKTLS